MVMMIHFWVLGIKVCVVDDFEHGDLRCLMGTSVWIGLRIATKLCRAMILRVGFTCYVLRRVMGSQHYVVVVLVSLRYRSLI